MKIQQRKLIWFILISISALAGCSQNEEPVSYSKADVKLQKYQWQGPLPQKSLVRVINRFGNITTRNTNQNRIELSGVIQKVGEHAPTPEILISDDDGITLVEVVYDSPTTDNFNNRIGRMDIGVYVPKGVTVEMETDFGNIKAKKHRSNLIAKSQSGKIKLATSGTINATSHSSNITANLLTWSEEKFKPQNKQRRYQIHSLEGDVQIYFSSQSGLDINLQAGNSITSQSSDLQSLIAEGINSVQLAIGNKERHLSVSSNQGSIQIDSVKSDSQINTPVTAQSLDTDIRNLPKAETWQPGDPIIEMEDGRSERNSPKQESSSKKFNRQPVNKKEQSDNQRSS